MARCLLPLLVGISAALMPPPIPIRAATPLRATARRAELTRMCSLEGDEDNYRRQPGQVGGRVRGDERARNGDDDAADTEYLQALADARRASARLAKAEQRLTTSPATATLRPARPRGARATVSRSDAGTLLVQIPAAGFGGGALVGGAFSVAWFSVVVPATVSMLSTGGASALFMLPFWAAGGLVAKDTLLDPLSASELSIGAYAWELSQRVAGKRVSAESGPSDELDGASVDVAAYVNGVPTYVLRLAAADGRTWSLGGGLRPEELEWLASEVNACVDTLGAGSGTK